MASSAEPAGRPRTIAIVAGEASGDLLGSQLILALREHLPALNVVGIGGPRMEAAGMDVWFPLEKLAVRGYFEVLRHYFEIVGIRRKLRRRLLKIRPDVFIGIDAPDFNLDLERGLKARGIPTVHYVSPAIWMWRRERLGKIKRAVSRMLTLFPFEEDIYRDAGVDVAFVGHPLADMLDHIPRDDAARDQLRLPPASPVVALLPGSRQGELKYMADLFIRTAKLIHARLPHAVFLVPLTTRETRVMFETALYHNDAEELPLTIMFGHAQDAMAAADVVLVASGTATLEAALLCKPMVITYKMPPATYWLLQGKGYLPYYGLPNILAREFVVPEFIQDDATPQNLSQALLNLLADVATRDRIAARFAAMSASLHRGAARQAALAVLPMLPD
ncbi:MAG TPA: lipid-A-disaccharide synthase [Casimicrobiaceae bacterium]|nr:lipid-A-disaccharide synthase [Casimicrobiaceae bacterium]